MVRRLMGERKGTVAFTWKDHLVGMWAMFSGDSKLQLRMRIKHLDAKGFGNSPIAHVLRHELAMLEFEK